MRPWALCLSVNLVLPLRPNVRKLGTTAGRLEDEHKKKESEARLRDSQLHLVVRKPVGSRGFPLRV